MQNTRAIRSRISSIENIRQITSSMKLVAASKHRRVQNIQLSVQSFEESTGELLRMLLGSEAAKGSPYMKPPGGKGRACYVLLLGNRGMCGGYNTLLMKKLLSVLEEDQRECSVIVCGRWGRDAARTEGLGAELSYEDIEDTPEADSIRPLSRRLTESYLAGEFEEISFVYQEFISVLKQQPAVKRLLPLELKADSAPIGRLITEPDAAAVRQRLEQMYIENTVFSTVLEAKRGEHAARMTAMTAASDNTEELLGKLQLKLNHARQAAITTEITEIVSGASALEN